MASALISTSPAAGGGRGLLDVGQDFGSAGLGDFDGMHADYPSRCETRPARRFPSPDRARRAAPRCWRVTATTPNSSRRCANGACTPGGCPGTTRKRCDADLVILRATWDYIERLDEFLAWTRRVRNLLNAPKVVAWNTDKRYLADLADAGVPTVPSRFFAPGERVRLPEGEVVVKPAVGAGSVGAQRFTDPDAAREHAAGAAGRRPHRAGAALRRPGGGRRDRAGVPRRPAVARVHQGPDPAAAGPAAGVRRIRHLRRGIAHTRRPRLRAVGCRACGAGRRGRPPRTSTRPSSCTPASTCSAARDDPQLLELELVEPSLGWRQLDATTRARQQREFALARGISPGPARAWPVLASTPIARRWPRCMRPRRRRGSRPARRAHR